MSRTQKPLTILYNESHSSVRAKKLSPQGGPGRFAQGFRNYFLPNTDFVLCPLLFSHSPGTMTPFLRTLHSHGEVFHELVYERDLIRSTYKKDWTRAQFVAYQQPFFDALHQLFEREQPDVVFLNGFSVSNWQLLYVAHQRGVPVVIQHAGIWKMEVRRSSGAFSTAMRRIYYDMERDTIRWCKEHIFLNTFSKKVFFHLYGLTDRDALPSAIVPLPITLPLSDKKNEKKPHALGDSLKIGMVARWDGIKNHSALLRLATSTAKPDNWSTHCVVAIPDNNSDFAKRYIPAVQIHTPMSPERLTEFYRVMDVILLPSHFDVSPTVAAESLLAGTPVIISDHVGWVDDFITNGLADHIVPTTVSGRALIRVIKSVVAQYADNRKKYAALVSQIRHEHASAKVFTQYAALFRAATK